MKKEEAIIFGLTNSNELERQLSKKLNVELGKIEKTVFKDGEILIKPINTVRGKNVFLIQSLSKPINTSIMEMLIFIDALKRASSKTISLILPYMGYSRQDRKSKTHEPITAKLISKLISTMNVDRIITFDLHSPQIEGFYDIPFDNLQGLPTLCNYIINKKYEDLVIVSPDLGGVVRARKLARALETDLAIINKRRYAANKTEVLNVLGEIKDKNCLIIDDMIDTGGTIINAAKSLIDKGAKSVRVACTHGLFNDDALLKFKNLDQITEILTTDTIPISKGQQISKLKVISIIPFLVDSINAIIYSKSLGKVYHKHTIIK